MFRDLRAVLGKYRPTRRHARRSVFRALSANRAPPLFQEPFPCFYRSAKNVTTLSNRPSRIGSEMRAALFPDVCAAIPGRQWANRGQPAATPIDPLPRQKNRITIPYFRTHCHAGTGAGKIAPKLRHPLPRLGSDMRSTLIDAEWIEIPGRSRAEIGRRPHPLHSALFPNPNREFGPHIAGVISGPLSEWLKMCPNCGIRLRGWGPGRWSTGVATD